ncbi:MAG: GNAT family N-acetyltransferase [Clostridia bacterium]
MNITAIRAELDLAYTLTFSSMEKRDWGYLFSNPDNPTHYDANHAQLSANPLNPQVVIEEVIAFYEQKGIIPRFYLQNVEALRDFIRLLQEAGFGYEEFEHAVQLWNGQVTEAAEDSRVSIEIVNDHNVHEALEVECSIAEFGGREVREKAFWLEYHNPAFTYYLLRVEGQPASTACLFRHGNHFRLENVATLEAYRGQGLIGMLIQHIQREVQKHEQCSFWIDPINERVEQVYSRYGFQTVGRLPMGHAFRGGKSIKEIQQG